MEFGNISEVMEGVFAEVFHVSLKDEVRVKYDTKVSDGHGEEMTCLENVMVVMENYWIWCGVATSMTFVLELFHCRKLFIHTFVSSRQVVRVDSSNGGVVGGKASEGCVHFYV